MIEQARASGTAPNRVRYYTRRGCGIPARNPANEHCLCWPRGVHRLSLVGQARRLGYTFGETLRIVKDAERGRSPCPRVRLILERRSKEHRKQPKEPMALPRRMEQALPHGIPEEVRSVV